MKILVVFPSQVDEMILGYERSFVPDYVDVIGLNKGFLAECPSDLVRNVSPLLDAIQDAEKKGYEAVVCSPASEMRVLRLRVNW